MLESSLSTGWEGEWIAMNSGNGGADESSKKTKIPNRSMHTASAINQGIYIFGGEEGDYGTMPRELWYFSLRTEEWQEPSEIHLVLSVHNLFFFTCTHLSLQLARVRGEQPPGRKRHTATVIGR